MSEQILLDLENAGIFVDKNSDNERLVGAIEEIGGCSDEEWDAFSKETQIWYHTCFEMLPSDEDEEPDMPQLPLPETYDIYEEELDWEDLDKGDLIAMEANDKTFEGIVDAFNKDYVAIISDGTAISVDTGNIESIFLVRPEDATTEEPESEAAEATEEPEVGEEDTTEPEKPAAPAKKKAPAKKPAAKKPAPKKTAVPASKKTPAKTPAAKKPARNTKSTSAIVASAFVREIVINNPEITKQEVIDALTEKKVTLSSSAVENVLYGTRDTIRLAKELGKWSDS